jgi:glutaredoxin
MSFRDDLKKRVRHGVLKAAGAAGRGAFYVFNRADEIGGEVRDYIVENVDNETLARWANKLAKIRGGSDADVYADPRRVAQDEAMAQATEAAPPPTQAEIAAAASDELGNPALPAQIYGSDACPWTGRARSALNNHRVDYDFVDTDEPENSYLEGRLIRETKQDTTPWVYLRGEFVGGFNELSEIIRLGQLDIRLMTSAEKDALGDHEKKVTVAKRD